MSASPPVRTSVTHPLRVGWVPVPPGQSGTRPRGRLGITLAPGKHAPSFQGPAWARDLAADLRALVDVHAAAVLVSLLEEEERAFLQIPTLLDEAARAGLVVRALAIPDGRVPTLAAARPLVAAIVADLDAGKTVVVHCRGGLGRAPTIAGCVLRALGLTQDETLAALLSARGPGVPETRAQAAFVGAFSAGISRADRISGAVLGAAIGDALGRPTEFLGLHEIFAAYGPEGIRELELTPAAGGGSHALFTDDTQMAVAVLSTLVDASPAPDTLDEIMVPLAEAFVAWSHRGDLALRAPGNACLAGCRALEAGVPWAEAGGPTAGGCGSVMRAYPFGLAYADDLERAERFSIAHSRLTHNDPIALAASAAMAVGVALVVRDASIGEIADAMIAAAARSSAPTAAMMQRAVEEARAGVGPEITLDRLRAWAAHEAIAAALYVFVRHPDDLPAAVREGANTPGDSDSIATLAGALVGARVGIAGIPKVWCEQIEDSAQLFALARRLAAR